MRGYLYGFIAAAGIVGAAVFSRRKQAARQTDEQLFYIIADEPEAADERGNARPGHKFAIGDPVIIADPIDPHGASRAKRGKIVDRKREENGYIDVYNIAGQPGWYNENWLTPDYLGPALLQPMPDRSTEPSRIEVDYWLATLSDSKRVGDVKGAAAAEAELRRLTTKEVLE